MSAQRIPVPTEMSWINHIASNVESVIGVGVQSLAGIVVVIMTPLSARREFWLFRSSGVSMMHGRLGKL